MAPIKGTSEGCGLITEVN